MINKQNIILTSIINKNEKISFEVIIVVDLYYLGEIFSNFKRL